MDSLIQDCPAVAYGAYVDDVVLTASPSNLDHVFTKATDHLAWYGLLLQPAKSVLWQTVPVPPQLELPALGPLMSEPPVLGLIICRHCLADADQDELPLGPDDFCGAWLLSKLEAARRFCARVQALLTDFALTSQASRLHTGVS